MEEVALIEQTGCSLHELKYLLPADDRMRHLSYKRIMDKARPELERQAKAKAQRDREAEYDEDY